MVHARSVVASILTAFNATHQFVPLVQMDIFCKTILATLAAADSLAVMLVLPAHVPLAIRATFWRMGSATLVLPDLQTPSLVARLWP